jgi:hypothetical protein
MELVVQAQPRPRQQRAHRRGADAQHRRDLGVAQALEAGQRERGALLRAQASGGRGQRRPPAHLRRLAVAREQVVARLARRTEDRDPEALPRARQAAEPGVGKQERILGGVARRLPRPEDPPAEGEHARAVGVPQRGERSGIPRRPRPHQLRLAARHAHGAASYVPRRAVRTARRTVVRTLRAFPVDRPAPATCGS